MMSQINSNKEGILLINKPVGLTSLGATKKVAKIYQIKKAGHAGTLDPFASGILPVCLGRTTSFNDLIIKNKKEYLLKIELGKETDTLDSEGAVIQTVDSIPKVSEADVLKVIQSLEGEVQLEIPKYSAKKYNGKPLYYWTRRGMETPSFYQEICIHKIELKNVTEKTIEVLVQSSKGAYMRSLAKELCKRLGTIGYLSGLTRTAYGSWALTSCSKIDDLMPDHFNPIKLHDLEFLDHLGISTEESHEILNGRISQSLDTKFVNIRSTNSDRHQFFQLERGSQVFGIIKLGGAGSKLEIIRVFNPPLSQ